MAIFPEVNSYDVYGEEDPASYGVAPGTVTSQFGIVQRVTGRVNNNYGRRGGVGAGRNSGEIRVAGILDAGINIDIEVITGAFLEYVFGTVTGAGTVASPFAYAEASTVPSLTIEDAYNLLTDQVLRLLGSVLKRCVIRCKLNEPVTATLEFDSYDVSKSATYQSINVSTTASYIFVHGAFELPSASALTEIQDCEITINNMTERSGGIGDRKGRVYVRTRGYSGKYTRRLVDGTGVEDAMGGATATSAGTPADVGVIRLNFTSGARYLRISLDEVKCNWEVSKELSKAIDETITFEAISGSAAEVI